MFHCARNGRQFANKTKERLKFKSGAIVLISNKTNTVVRFFLASVVFPVTISVAINMKNCGFFSVKVVRHKRD